MNRARGLHNTEIAERLDEIADLLELEDGNPFRIRAYRNASRLVRGLPTEITDMLERGEKLSDLPGIGDDLAGKLTELARHGMVDVLLKLRRKVPRGLPDLMRLPGLGPKRVRALSDELDIHTPDQLRRALIDGKVGALPGFGAKLEQQLRAALARDKAPKRWRINDAEPIANSLIAALKTVPGVHSAIVAGSYRRGRETVGDLDLLVSGGKADAVLEKLRRHPDIGTTLAEGPTRASYRTRAGLQVDVRQIPAESRGAALVYFTGSKAHNIVLRRMAQKRGLKINEYGVFRGARRIAGETEESVYRSLGLAFIPPELREDKGEIDAAARGKLPRLIELGDLRGDLHVHTRATDGADTIEAMADAAQRAGLEYIAITEHSKRIAMVHGLDAKHLAQQGEKIDRYNKSNPRVHVFKGIEVDILPDGSLDLPGTALEPLDLVIVAVHSSFNLSREAQTARILAAMEHRCVSIVAHPSGRLIGTREPYDVDMPRIIRKARERGIALELNAHPERLDLLDTHCRMAAEAGVAISVNSDAHSARDFAFLRYGILQARRGWLERRHVLNAWQLDDVRSFLARGRAGGARKPGTRGGKPGSP